MKRAARYNSFLTFQSSIPRNSASDAESAYPTEAHLVDFAQKSLPGFFGCKGNSFFLDTEVNVGRSIADLVLLIGPDRGTNPPAVCLSVTESVILAALRNGGPTRIDLLELRCGFERQALRQGALDRLSRMGILLRGEGGRIALGSDCVQSATIIAVEAKLTKWRPALDQALLYRRYADRAYVLLPANNAQGAIKAKSEFADAGVGLLIATDTEINNIIEAAPGATHDWRRDFVYFRLLARKVIESTSDIRN